MRSQKLTHPIVKKLPAPPKGNTVYWDSEVKGFGCRVTAGGAKSFILNYRDGAGRERRYTIGSSSEWNTTAAREQARDWKARIRSNGTDPLGEREAMRAEAEAKRAFKDVAEEFIRRHVDANKLRSKPEIERCLKRYVYPAWQDLPFVEIRRGDVSKLLDHIEDQNGARQADMVLAIISKMTRWFQARNDDYISPVVPGMKRNIAADRKRKRVLDDAEIRAVWNACQGTFGDIVKVLLLTGQRREKVGTMRWADIINGVWHIPSEAREKSTAGILKLSQQAVDILNAKDCIEDNPFVFKARGKGPFNSYSERKAELDAKLPGMEPWTLHDLRRTAKSLMARAGVRPDISERTLGHAIAGVEGVYDRHSYTDEKADALKRLGALIDRILSREENGGALSDHHQA